MPQPLLHATARRWIMVSRTWVKTQTWDAEATRSGGRDQVGQWQPLLALTQAAEAAQTSDGSLAAGFPITAVLCAPPIPFAPLPPRPSHANTLAALTPHHICSTRSGATMGREICNCGLYHQQNIGPLLAHKPHLLQYSLPLEQRP